MAARTLPLPIAFLRDPRVATFATDARLPGGVAQAIGLFATLWGHCLARGRRDVHAAGFYALELADVARVAGAWAADAFLTARRADPPPDADPLVVWMSDRCVGWPTTHALAALIDKRTKAGHVRSRSHAESTSTPSSTDPNRGLDYNSSAHAESIPSTASMCWPNVSQPGENPGSIPSTASMCWPNVSQPHNEPAHAESIPSTASMCWPNVSQPGEKPGETSGSNPSDPTGRLIPLVAHPVLSDLRSQISPSFPDPRSSGDPAVTARDPAAPRAPLTPNNCPETRSEAMAGRACPDGSENAPRRTPDPVLRERRRQIRLRIWDRLSIARQTVARTLGQVARPLMAQDPGELDLAAYLTTHPDLDSAERDLNHALDMAIVEATERDRSVMWLTGAIFAPAKLRVLLGMTADDARRARSGSRSGRSPAQSAGTPAIGPRKVKTL